MLWKTEIPGEGWSSPIVSGDAIYLTTAYLSTREQLALQLAQWIQFVLAIVVVSAGMAHISKRNFLAIPRSSDRRLLIKAILTFGAILLLSGYVLFGKHVLGLTGPAVTWISLPHHSESQ